MRGTVEPDKSRTGGIVYAWCDLVRDTAKLIAGPCETTARQSDANAVDDIQGSMKNLEQSINQFADTTRRECAKRAGRRTTLERHRDRDVRRTTE